MLEWVLANLEFVLAALVAAGTAIVAIWKWVKNRVAAEKERDMRCDEHRRKLEEVIQRTSELENQIEELRTEVSNDRVNNTKTAAQIEFLVETNSEIRDDIRAIFKMLNERS